MNIRRCESWLRETQAMMQQVEQLQAQIDHANGIIPILQKAGDLERLHKAQQHRAQLQDVLGKAEAVLLERTRRATIDEADVLQRDLAARLEGADMALNKWRAAKAEFEFRVAANDLADRAEAERQLTTLKDQLDLRVRLAAELIPEQVLVLTV